MENIGTKNNQRIWAIKIVINWLLDLLFPKFCVICGEYGDFLCEKCLGKLPQEAKYISSRVLYKKKRAPKIFANHIQGVWYFWNYRDARVKKVIHSYKFGLLKSLADQMATLVGQFLKQAKKMTGAEAVLIPPDKGRKRMRGFDHIAEMVEEKLVSPSVRIFRVKKTFPQVAMQTKNERWKNLKDVFSAEVSGKISPQAPIILIDDIFTSGATATYVAKALARLGYKKIFLLVLAMQEF